MAVKVVVVRGAALNPFEMQAYQRVAGTEFQLTGIGRRRPPYELSSLDFPIRLLHAPDERRITTALARRASRLAPRVDPERLIGLERELRGADIVHAAETSFGFSERIVRFARKEGSRAVLTCWENIPFRFDEDSRLRARKAHGLAHADLFIAVTPSARDALLEEGAPADRIKVVPAGVDTARFQPGPADSALLRTWGVPTDALTILFVGRLIQEKGIIELVRAVAPILRSKQGQVHLVTAGSGPEGPRIVSAARAAGVADRVHVVDGIPYSRVPAAFASADIVAVPSLPTPYWQEQFGMVLIEAMACAKPIVTTSSGSIPEVVGDAAILVEPYRPKDLGEAISAMIEDPTMRKDYGLRGRALVEQRYDSDIVAEKLRESYRQVMNLPERS